MGYTVYYDLGSNKGILTDVVSLRTKEEKVTFPNGLTKIMYLILIERDNREEFTLSFQSSKNRDETYEYMKSQILGIPRQIPPITTN